MSFVHLHVHSHYSLLDGLGSPKTFVKLAKEQGSPAIALTDHGYLYGAIEFYKSAKEIGIKPIIGCEVYLTDGSRFDKSTDNSNRYFHLILLAKNLVGYKNLMYLVSYASLEGFYYKPRIDFELLENHSEGLIALSGCLASELPQAILENDETKQFKIIEKYKSIFGIDNYYFELQEHPEISEQTIVNKRLIELSKQTNIQLVATQDSHYPTPKDAIAQDILLCIQTQTNVNESNRMKFNGDFSLLPPQAMRHQFRDFPEACDNTLKIAEQVDLTIKFGDNLIPTFDIPENFKNSKTYLRHLCEIGLKQLYPPEQHQIAQKQLDYELDVVHRMGFDDYFLIVHDFVKYAKENQIAVGPGRGSAAGSIIAFCLNITELDPLKYGLIFERFLNPERISMPDIDIDFADHRRLEVLNYVVQKYGRNKVAQIITFGTMAAKAAVRDVGRGLGYPYNEVDRIAKLIPPPVLGKHKPLSESIQTSPELKHDYETNPITKSILDNAIKLEGTVRHAGTHASAVVISRDPLIEHTPIQKAITGENEIITQYSMKPLDEIGLLKMDFLGLKNLTIIENTLKIVEQTQNIKIDLANISLNDEITFKLLQNGETMGIFQLESEGMRRYIKELKPTDITDIIAMISLYRPGPMEYIPMYIKGKHNPSSIEYLSPLFEPILKETYGVAIYQEQILLIARQFAGFSLGEADILRKAVGKKDPKLLEEQKEQFIKGAIKQGHNEKFATDIFTKIVEPFAGYGFNKAHAACYAMISYRTAYLKAHFPTAFMAAMLTSDQGNIERIAEIIEECEIMDIKVLPPSINQSEADFTVLDSKTIRFGLNGIKGIGEGPVKEILRERKLFGKYTSLSDFASRLPSKLLNKKTLESLAFSGALDDFGDRKQIAENFETINKYSKNNSKHNLKKTTNQGGLFENDPILSIQSKEPLVLNSCSSQTTMEKLLGEKKYLGIYVSGHPLQGLTRYLEKKVTLISNLSKKHINKPIKIGGLISKIKQVMTKSKKYMAYLELEDSTGKIEVVIFPKIYDRVANLIRENHVLIITGKLSPRKDILQFNCDDLKTVSLETMIQNAIEQGIYNPNEKIKRSKINLSSELKTDLTTTTSEISKQTTPYTIKIPAKFKPEDLGNLKLILEKFPGSTPVQLEIANKSNFQLISTNIKINIVPDLENAINQTLNS